MTFYFKLYIMILTKFHRRTGAIPLENTADTLPRQIRLQLSFQDLCERMKAAPRFELEIRRFWRSDPDKTHAAAAVMKTPCRQTPSREEAETFSLWMQAYFSRNTTRRPVTEAEKQAMWNRQHGICPCCGRIMGQDMSQNHADHLIPFTYVGDMLADNLRLTHAGCNLSKGSSMSHSLERYRFDSAISFHSKGATHP